MSMPGGVGEAKPATAEIQEIANKVRGDLESKTKKSYAEFTAVSYASQVVAGTNFFIKVKVGAAEFIHLRVFRDLQAQVALSSYQENKAEGDDITYF